MKILLIRPQADPETIGLQHVMLVEPLELEVLATLAPARDECVIADLLMERRGFRHFLRTERPDVVCITGYITNVPAMLEYCRQTKRHDDRIATVVGGVHCEVCPEDLDDPAVDFRVVRNAAVVFTRLIEHIRGGEPRPEGVFGPGEAVDRAALPDFDWTFPIPERHLTARYRSGYFYIFHDRVALLKTAFGCPYHCNFCFCREITDHRFHVRPQDQVIREIAGIAERSIYIVDDDFLTSRARVRDFIDANRSYALDKRYLLYGRADFIAHNPDLIEQFRDVGLSTVIVGFESFDDRELQTMDKGIDAATNAEAIRTLQRLGVDCYATIILQPHWGHEEFALLGRKLRELKIAYVNLQPLTPLPGTGVTVPDEDLVIPREDFARWDLAHVTVRPTQLTVPEYYQAIIDGYTSTLYQVGPLLGYLKYPPRMLYKMISGNSRVYRQYVRKRQEAQRLA